MEHPPTDRPENLTADSEIPELRDYPPVMTTQQVAEALQINDQVVRRRLNTGQWPGFRAGVRDWRMRRLTVRAIILGQLGDNNPADHDPVAGEAEESPSG